MAKKKRAAGSSKERAEMRPQPSDGESGLQARERQRTWLPPLVFALLSLLIYIDVLFDSARAPASPYSDLTFQFLAWRTFGFAEMASGNLPLWNPHIFGGTPYLGSFQSALLYPPNWLHLILPLGLAISWTYGLHTFLMGWTMSLWARYRGVGLGGQTLAGLMMMFSGQFFLHGYAGHLPHLGAMAWAPLIFLATDALADGKGLRWILVGAGALALQILAGHPQYVFYTGLLVGVYALLRLRKLNRRGLLSGLVALTLLGAALAAIQLLPGIEASGENIRTSGLPYAMASEFSFSPVQALTALAPYIFGHHATSLINTSGLSRFYLGQGYLWEMCLFVGVIGLVLAGLGFSGLRRDHKIAAGILLVLSGLLALGRHTPLHQVLYRCLPFFDSFRAPAKFAFFTSMFLALLAAEGFQAVERGDRLRSLRMVERVLLVGAAFLIVVVLLTRLSLAAVAKPLSAWLADSNDHFILGAGDYARPEVWAALQKTVFFSLAATATVMLVAGLLVRWRRRSSMATRCLLIVAGFEMLAFACCGRSSMEAKVEYPEEYDRQIVGREQPYRTLHPGTTTNLKLQNAAMARGTFDMWGYDPGVLQRYGQLMTASQDADPDKATQVLRFVNESRMDGLYRMFRLKWLCLSKPEMHVKVQPRPLEQVELVGRHEVVSDRASMFSKLLDPAFDPKAVVYLEQTPAIAPAGSPVQGEAKVVWQDSDTLEIRAHTDRPALLLVTDNYAKGWRTEAMTDSSQREYQLLAANHTLRAVPLAAGTHHLRMVYRPTGWVVGCWISLTALLGVSAVWLISRARRRRLVARAAT